MSTHLPSWRALLRPIRKLCIILVLAYVVALGVLWFFEDYLVYFPRSPAMSWAEPHGLTAEDVALDAAGVSIHGWWCPKERAASTLLYVHGNGGNLSLRAPIYQKLQAEFDVSVLAVDYPGYGKSKGRPTEAGCYAAGLAAYDWLTREKNIPPGSIILFGESLGGGVAAELATRRECQALVLYSSFTSVPEVARDRVPIFPVRMLMHNRFDNLAKIPRIGCPIFIAHGEADTIIRISHAHRIRAVAPGAVTLHIDRGRGHDVELTPEFIATFRAFLMDHPPASR